VDLLLRRHRALTQVCRSGLDLGSRGTMATATQLTMDMGIIRMDIIDHIRITVTTQDLRSIGPAAIESTTATIVTITTGIGTKLT
jgi:hypothetical protein